MRMTFKTVLIGGLLVFFAVVLAVVFIPTLVWNPPQTVVAEERTPLEEQGREVFYRNGCNYCHTQYVRFYDTASGDVSQGGNYVFDNPMILGSERTGPDLSYIGRKRSEAWEIRHWKDPRAMSPLSIMANFEFLPEEDLKAMAAYLFSLGDRVAMEQMILPPVTYFAASDPIPYQTVSPAPDGTAVGWPNFNASQLQAGKEIYISNCLTCHGCAGNGLGSYGGTMTVTPANFKQDPFRDMPDDQWFWHVSEGIQGSLMPTWKESLSETERWQVIRYVQQIFAHPTERDPDEGDPTGIYVGVTNPLPKTVATLDQGKHIFTRECLVCHGDSGHGEGMYGSGLLPAPPDFSDLPSYADWTDADYFWRISEGVPWTAMPTWRIEYDDADRWSLVYYIRVNFTQTEPRPGTTTAQVYPAIDLAQTMPVQKDVVEVITGDLTQSTPNGPSFDTGRSMYLQMCAHCHGVSGKGDGFDGQYLDPKPADFTAPDAQGLSDGDWFSRVTYGLQNTAMPTWGEWMPIPFRWSVILYIQKAFVEGLPVNASQFTGQVAVNYIGLSRDLWFEEGHTISETHGSDLYGMYCVDCHAARGQGMGPGTVDNPSGSPAAFPTDMTEPYIFWRTAEGVPNSDMYPFKAIFTQQDLWDMTAYVESLIGLSP